MNEEVAEPCKKQQKTGCNAEVNLLYKDAKFITDFKRIWEENKDALMDGGASFSGTPFRHVMMPNFIQDTTFLADLKDELLELEFHKKNNDLYKFCQTDELQGMEVRNVNVLIKFFTKELRKWLREITGIPLNDMIDMFCAQYKYTDVLLCHDDELDGRRIAYILYLVPSWTQEDGGTLDLFGVDEEFHPTEVVKSLVPAWNTFTFFEVGPGSFHQVSEVLSKDKTRLSITGWFHGPPINRPQVAPEPPLELHDPTFIEENELYRWINPTYLLPEVQSEIRERFEEESEVELHNFLQEERYKELCEVLCAENVNWMTRGPPNKRKYEVIGQTSLPEVVKLCLQFFKSEAMFLTLSNLTGLTFHKLAGKKIDSNGVVESTGEEEEPYSGTPRCSHEVRRWSPGCYTLVTDEEADSSEACLDASLFLNCDKWEDDFGGNISYIAHSEEDELLSVHPRKNSLALVYRDQDTFRFMKHLNDRSKVMESKFHDITLTYYE